MCLPAAASSASRPRIGAIMASTAPRLWVPAIWAWNSRSGRRRPSRRAADRRPRISDDEQLHVWSTPPRPKVGDLVPAVVDREGMAAIGKLLEVGHGRRFAIELVSGAGGDIWDHAVLLTGDQKQRTAIGILCVHDGGGAATQVAEGGLKRRPCR